MPRHRLQVAPTTSRPSAKFFRQQLRCRTAVPGSLARFRHLKVAGPSAVQTCRALGLSVEQSHERLGVSYAVEGSVSGLGNRLVITFSIADLKSNSLVNGDRFEGKFEDLIIQQSVMIDRIASTLFNRSQQAEIDRLSGRLTNDIGAYEFYLTGFVAHRRGGISTQNAHDAVRHFENAIIIDPDFGRAYRRCSQSWFASDYVDEIGKSTGCWCWMTTMQRFTILPARCISPTVISMMRSRILIGQSC